MCLVLSENRRESMSVDRELEYIKLKVDWYKSVFPWILAMVVGVVTVAGSITPDNAHRRFALHLLFLSIIFLFLALVSCWYASLALIHRLEGPYKTKWAVLNWILWVPHGTKWELVCGSLASICLSAGLTTFICGLITYGYHK